MDAELLDFARTALESEMLDQVCVILKNESISNGAGGYTEAWVEYGDDIPCRVEHQADEMPFEEVRGDKVVATTEFLISMPYDTEIDAGDRIAVGSDVFEIIGQSRPHSEQLLLAVNAKIIL